MMAVPTKTQLVGGGFQDAEGDVLSNGKLIMRLSSDESVPGIGQICSGIDIIINLDSEGNVSVIPPQSVWANNNMLPINSYYRVTGYAADGQLAFGPNNQQVISPGPFDVGTWIPNTVISWFPPPFPPLLETNGTPNTVQSIENLIAGTGITLTADNAGGTTIAASGGGGAVTGSGTTNTVAKWTSSSAIGNSALTDNGSTLTYGGTEVAFSTGANITTDTVSSIGRLHLFGENGNTGAQGGQVSILAGSDGASNIGAELFLSGGSPSSLGNTAGDAELVGGAGSDTNASGGNVYLSPGRGNGTGKNGAVKIYYQSATSVLAPLYLSSVTFANLTAPSVDPITSSTHGALVFCSDAKGPQDSITWGSTAAGSGTGALLRYNGSNWTVVG